MKRLLILMIIVLSSCSANDEITEKENKGYFIVIEKDCRTNVTTMHAVEKNTYLRIRDYINKHGNNCSWIEFDNVDGTLIEGYYHSLK